MATEARQIGVSLRASLITLVSTKNISGPGDVVLSLEVGIEPHIRHRSQQFGQIAAGWSQQGSRKDGPMLGFGTAAMSSSPLLEGLHNSFLNTTHQQICHPSINA